MSQVISGFVRPTEFNFIKENAQVARCDESCDEVMNVALIVFASMAAVIFVSCLTAAVILSSAALGAAAGATALFALTILLPSAMVMRPAHSGYTEIYDAPEYGELYHHTNPKPVPHYTSYHDGYVPVQPGTPRRGDVPQRSPSKVRSHQRVSSAPVAHHSSRTATVHGHVVPGQDRNRR